MFFLLWLVCLAVARYGEFSLSVPTAILAFGMILAIAGMLYSVNLKDMSMFYSLIIYFFALVFVAFIGIVRSIRRFGSIEAEAFGLRWDFPASLGRIGIGFLSAGFILFLVSDSFKVYAYVPAVFLSVGGTLVPMIISFLFYMFVVALVENQMCVTVSEAVRAPFSGLRSLAIVVSLFASIAGAAVLALMHFAAYGFGSAGPYVFAFFAFFIWMFMFYIFNGDATPGIVSHGWYDFCVISSWAGLTGIFLLELTVALGLAFILPWFIIGAYRGNLSLWRRGYSVF